MSSLLTVKVRLLQKSIELIETQLAQPEAEGDVTDKFIVWRRLTIRSEEIWTINEYDKEKCMITTYSGEEYLAKETYDSLHAKWMLAKKYEPKKSAPQEEVEDEDEE